MHHRRGCSLKSNARACPRAPEVRGGLPFLNLTPQPRTPVQIGVLGVLLPLLQTLRMNIPCGVCAPATRRKSSHLGAQRSRADVAWWEWWRWWNGVAPIGGRCRGSRRKFRCHGVWRSNLLIHRKRVKIAPKIDPARERKRRRMMRFKVPVKITRKSQLEGQLRTIHDTCGVE